MVKIQPELLPSSMGTNTQKAKDIQLRVSKEHITLEHMELLGPIINAFGSAKGFIL
jgi:hypothetical protein